MATALKEPQYPPISRSLDDNVHYLNQLIGVGESWDIIAKRFAFGGLKMVSYVANGFFLTMNMILILEDVECRIRAFLEERNGDSFTLEEIVGYLQTHVAFVQVQPVRQMSDAVRFILSGPLVTFIDGFDQAFMIDTRIYPMRGIEPPQVERVVRGNHDAFTETMLMNTALIRRRIRDPRLRVELMQVGTRSQTDVSLVYLKDVADPDIVERIRAALRQIDAEALALGEQEVMDAIGRVRWNPYPVARYTERPDVAVTALLEGQVVIVVDTTAEVIIAPTTLFQHLQHPQEYHSYPLVGTYMRWVILMAVFVSIFLPGVFLLLNAHPALIPPWMAYFKAVRSDPLPLWVELIVAEIMLDILRLAVLNTPMAVASSVSIIAAVIFSQFASQIHLLQPEVLVYMAIVMVAQYATSSYELGSANQLARFWILLWTAAAGAWGFGIGVISWLLLLLRTRSFGIPYLWPLFPFKWRNGMRDIVFRLPLPGMHGVPDILRPRRRGRS
ncbi:MAG: spore germination protein [Alicyclobacillaceae bacterium]|nr:spore germination protein [Alicyclobacillaceae bacterium]